MTDNPARSSLTMPHDLPNRLVSFYHRQRIHNKMNSGETYVSIDLYIIIRLDDNRTYTAYTIHGSVLMSHSTRNPSATNSTDHEKHLMSPRIRRPSRARTPHQS